MSFSDHINYLLLMLNYLFQLFQRKIFGLADRQELNIAGKVVLVTGANSGIGKTVATELACRGAIVLIACRNLKEGGRALDDIRDKSGASSTNLFLFQLDLGDLSSVRKCADEIKAKFKEIFLLVNNAGIANTSDINWATKDGFESNMGVNHLGHFLFTNLLLSCLKRGAPSRVVILSSTNQLTQKLDFDDFMLEKSLEKRVGFLPYDNSKYANSLFGMELAKKVRGTGVTVYSLCPGLVDTNVFRYLHWTTKIINTIKIIFFGLTPEQGAETVLYCALSKKCTGESGLVYRFSKPHYGMTGRLKEDLAVKLWDVSEKLVDLK